MKSGKSELSVNFVRFVLIVVYCGLRFYRKEGTDNMAGSQLIVDSMTAAVDRIFQKCGYVINGKITVDS